MNTPICDFVREYSETGDMRLHMPGHKGRGILGFEELDITEITGADSLYEADGIIRESERNASALFGCDTFYSAEGSSLCIRAMLYLAVAGRFVKGERPLILAGRNAHKTFLSAAALLDLDIMWLGSDSEDSYLSCRFSAETLERELSGAERLPAAVYVTSPDYLGNIAPIEELAAVCKRHGVLLLVDNAHGAYLRFLQSSAHPIDLGADMCCDSAHKTLPVLTGGAYLHISDSVAPKYSPMAKNAMALFGSTSPSYLILQSLDAANRYMAEGYAERLKSFSGKLMKFKAELSRLGYSFCGDECMKLTFSAKPHGYTGTELQSLLEEKGIMCEFADPDFLVLMFTPEISDDELARLYAVLGSIPKREPIIATPPRFHATERVMSVREAAFSTGETIPVEKSVGRVLAAASVGCPPAVPIVICGEKIDSDAVECFKYYGISSCTVVKESLI